MFKSFASILFKKSHVHLSNKLIKAIYQTKLNDDNAIMAVNFKCKIKTIYIRNIQLMESGKPSSKIIQDPINFEELLRLLKHNEVLKRLAANS